MNHKNKRSLALKMLIFAERKSPGKGIKNYSIFDSKFWTERKQLRERKVRQQEEAAKKRALKRKEQKRKELKNVS